MIEHRNRFNIINEALLLRGNAGMIGIAWNQTEFKSWLYSLPMCELEHVFTLSVL